MSQTLWEKMELLRTLAAETGRVINLEWTSELTFASKCFELFSDMLPSFAGMVSVMFLLCRASHAESHVGT